MRAPVRISTRLTINIVLSSATVLIIILAFGFSMVIEKRARERDAAADQVMRGIFELNLLADYYLRHPEDRPREQWKMKHRSLTKILTHMVNGPEENLEFRKMNRSLSDLDLLFGELVSTYEKKDFVPGAGRRVLARKREQLADLLSLRSREISWTAERIVDESRAEISEINRKIFFSFFSGALLFLLLKLFFLTRIRKSIIERIGLLGKGTEIIGSGDLDFRIGLESGDELGQLSSAFDAMTEKLKTTMVSRNELIKEVEDRRRMEGKVRMLNDRLRTKIDELAAANSELESFSYSVSHDLRAPLRHISGFIGLLNKNGGEKLDEKSRHYLTVITEAAGQMGRLIDDLLSFSRAGRVEMNRTRFPLDGVVREVINSLEREAEGRNIEWSIAPLPEVFGDRALLKLVWTNLISNSLKFTRPRETGIVDINAEEEEGEWIFRLKDNGVGFDMKYRDKLFAVFQRLHRSEDFDGTGIGLANVQRIINRHGGRVWAEGVPGEGATFYFSLPK